VKDEHIAVLSPKIRNISTWHFSSVVPEVPNETAPQNIRSTGPRFSGWQIFHCFTGWQYFFCFYEILLGDQLPNKFAWDFNFFLCCRLETANRLRSG